VIDYSIKTRNEIIGHPDMPGSYSSLSANRTRTQCELEGHSVERIPPSMLVMSQHCYDIKQTTGNTHREYGGSCT